MKRILNKPENYADETLKGIYKAHSDMVTYVNDDLRCYVKKDIKPGRVGIATGGGSGHLPVFLGYVGEGMIDGCSVGGVFQSPSANQMFEVTKAINAGAGVLYIYGNYTGDIMNFDMAAEMADMESDIRVESVVGADDVASAKKGEEHKRRGVAGIFYMFKIAGAAADEMMDLDNVKRVAEKVGANVRTMGVALSPCIIPEIGKANFTVEDGMMELGMGIHGEPGIDKGPLKTANEIVEIMLDNILGDNPLKAGDEVSVLVNSLGGTPKEELYIMYNKVEETLTNLGIKVVKTYLGEFATSMEMVGASLTILKLDEETKRLLLKPAHTPFFSQK
ncbi:dihydroxyacetone kinase subunit DhaK [Mycoplasmatota bacterium]|nr:dihydroxyacetone kinase subunit DhaK [Mycoplasmatota bacterium]